MMSNNIDYRIDGGKFNRVRHWSGQLVRGAGQIGLGETTISNDDTLNPSLQTFESWLAQ